jgi:hypothetical protein
VVVRDRAEAYGAGIRQGAPDATQVADRFHLFQNVAAALREVFRAHSLDIEALHEAKHRESLSLDDGSLTVPVGPPGAPSRAQQQIEHNRARRVAEYEQARALHQPGWTIKAISTHLGRHHRSVQKYLQASTFPERKRRQAHSRQPPSSRVVSNLAACRSSSSRPLPVPAYVCFTDATGRRGSSMGSTDDGTHHDQDAV